jgi:hypothetical protein
MLFSKLAECPSHRRKLARLICNVARRTPGFIRLDRRSRFPDALERAEKGVVQDRHQPSAKGRTGVPRIKAAYGPVQAFLDQAVCLDQIMRQKSRETAQSRDFSQSPIGNL